MTKNAPVPDSLAVSQLCLNTPALGLEGIVSKRVGSRYVQRDTGMAENEQPAFRAAMIANRPQIRGWGGLRNRLRSYLGLARVWPRTRSHLDLYQRRAAERAVACSVAI